MAEQQTEFFYRNIELYKSESLGSGSYGGVCKAKCDGLLCAAKIMHPTLFDLRDPGTISYLRKFQEECRLLSLARHPNVVQYLATYSDPETRLPVLLMELCDESLTRFLGRSPGPLPYHTQLNISHDIALALVYLHSNGLIHRDLTGNNVLMIAGTRAKVTDFGMSKLTSVNPRMTALTLCPGNVLYMSPEALDEAKSYTDKLDVFSFGVLVIQILTRQFPDPTDRFRTVQDTRYDEEVRLVVPETQRRHAHLQLISDTHPLKPLALQCLKKKDRERPSAQQLSERLSELKLAPQYTESMQQAQASSRDGGREEADALRRQIQEQVVENGQLQQQLQGQKILTEAKMKEANQHLERIRTMERQLQEYEQSLEQKDRTISDLQQTISAHERKIQQLEQQERASGGRDGGREEADETRQVFELEQQIEQQATQNRQLEQQLRGQRILTEAKTREVSQQQTLIETKDRQLEESQRTKHLTLAAKERDLQQEQQQLQVSEQLVAEFQQSLEQKDRTISDLQQTISAHERKIQQLEQQEGATGGQPRQLPVTADTPQVATASAAQKDIAKLKWREGKKAPEKMTRGAAVAHGNTAYFNPDDSHKVYSYQIMSGAEQWSSLPDNPYETFSLAVIDSLLTSVGGHKLGSNQHSPQPERRQEEAVV